MEGKQEEVENEMKGVFQEFCQRYKKYTKSELSSEDAVALYEAFVCNYESIRLYMRSNKMKNEKDISRIAQLWDGDFIMQYFSNDAMIAKELGITLEEVQENFGRGVKLYFAVKNISDPMEALRRVKKHLDETLSDEAIMRELGLSFEEVQENFGRGVKLHFAVKNISDPMEALRRVKKHLDETLSDEAIMRELGLSFEEVQENFGRGVKLYFAVGNISDPMEALRRVKKHLDETLSDEEIMKELGITLEEVQENFGRGVKLHFAVGNISDPMEALRRVKKHLDETLSDEAIMRELGLSFEEVQENFGRGVKLHFAVKNISEIRWRRFWGEWRSI
jgi:lysyl-tRNA synthetase class I